MFAVSGIIIHRRLPGTLRASERLLITISGIFLHLQLSLLLPGWVGALEPLWVTFTAAFWLAIVFLIAARFDPAPLLKLPIGDRTDTSGLRNSGLALGILVVVVATYSLLVNVFSSLSYTDHTVHLSRIADWIRIHSIELNRACDPRAIAIPVPLELPALFQILFFHSDRMIGIWSWFGWLFCGIASYSVATRWLESRAAAVISVCMALLAPSLLSLSTGIDQTGWQIGFIIAGLHFLTIAHNRPRHSEFAFLVAVVMLGTGVAMQPDLPIDLIICAALILLFAPKIRKREIIRGFILFLLIGGWNRIWMWVELGNPIAPMLPSLFQQPEANNAVFNQLFLTSNGMISLSRMVSRCSAMIMPIPLSESDAGASVGAGLLLAGIPGLLLLLRQSLRKVVVDPVFIGFSLIFVTSILLVPSPIWRQTPLIAVTILLGIGSGFFFQKISRIREWMLLIAVVPVAITVMFTIPVVSNLQFKSRTPIHLPTQFPNFISQYPLPDRIAVYPADWIDLWSLSTPRNNPRIVIPIEPDRDLTTATQIAIRNGCDWLIVTDSPLHRIRRKDLTSVVPGWELIADEQRVLVDPPGWLRVLVFRRVQNSTAGVLKLQ